MHYIVYSSYKSFLLDLMTNVAHNETRSRRILDKKEGNSVILNIICIIIHPMHINQLIAAVMLCVINEMSQFMHQTDSEHQDAFIKLPNIMQCT